MTPDVLARFRPKVEPDTEKMGPLYDGVEQAVNLINCAYFATREISDDDVSKAVRQTLDDGIQLLRDVKDQLHDMIVWA